MHSAKAYFLLVLKWGGGGGEGQLPPPPFSYATEAVESLW